MSLSDDVKAFVVDHRPHGPLTGDAGELTPYGYSLEILCRCGASFRVWIAPGEAAEELAMLARLN